MFHRIKKMKPIKQALFTLLIGIAVVAFWRGTWVLMEAYLLPESKVVSGWISILIGLSVLAVTHYWTRELA
ncbi:hypothetical protein HYS47_01215 [Candidatus Woesearchaeota archaeon]|nr:hypothetical protein [Candidatus Woesearchaeota archaeon]